MARDISILEIISFILEEFYQLLTKETSVVTVEDNKKLIYKQMVSSFEVVDKNKRKMKCFVRQKENQHLFKKM